MNLRSALRLLANESQQMAEIEKLVRVWSRLSPRTRAAILVLAGIREAPLPKSERKPYERAPKGTTPPWLLPALNLLKDTSGNLPDREIARRMGIAHSTLLRNQTYQNAKKAYFLPHMEARRKDEEKLGRKQR